MNKRSIGSFFLSSFAHLSFQLTNQWTQIGFSLLECSTSLLTLGEGKGGREGWREEEKERG